MIKESKTSQYLNLKIDPNTNKKSPLTPITTQNEVEQVTLNQPPKDLQLTTTRTITYPKF